MDGCPGLVNVSVIDIRAGGPYDLGRYVETYLPTIPELPVLPYEMTSLRLDLGFACSQGALMCFPGGDSGQTAEINRPKRTL